MSEEKKIDPISGIKNLPETKKTFFKRTIGGMVVFIILMIWVAFVYKMDKQRFDTPVDAGTHIVDASVDAYHKPVDMASPRDLTVHPDLAIVEKPVEKIVPKKHKHRHH